MSSRHDGCGDAAQQKPLLPITASRSDKNRTGITSCCFAQEILMRISLDDCAIHLQSGVPKAIDAIE